jgi:hypothetical protein
MLNIDVNLYLFLGRTFLLSSNFWLWSHAVLLHSCLSGRFELVTPEFRKDFDLQERKSQSFCLLPFDFVNRCLHLVNGFDDAVILKVQKCP